MNSSSFHDDNYALAYFTLSVYINLRFWHLLAALFWPYAGRMRGAGGVLRVLGV